MGILSRLYLGMDKASRAVSKALEMIAGTLIALCAAALLFQVIYRFIIVKFVSFSFPFTEEFARYALIWSAYLCVGMCLKEGSMASVNLVYDRLGPKSKLALYYLTRAVVAVFLVVGIVYGIQVVQNNLIFKSATLRVPGPFLYGAPLVGCFLMTYEMLTELLGVASGQLQPFAAGAIEAEDEE